MNEDFEARQKVGVELARLMGGDPYDQVLRAAEAHRGEHGPECGLYPAGPLVMRLVASIVRSASSKRIIDLGTGFGYSALWLSDAAGPDVILLAIDRFEEHVERAEGFAAEAGLGERIRFVAGEAAAVLAELEGSWDLIHDDAWFANEPPHLQAMIDRLRPGGVITMANWFLLEDAITGQPRNDWSAFAGDDWATTTRSYAARLAQHPALSITWTIAPPLAIAVKQS